MRLPIAALLLLAACATQPLTRPSATLSPQAGRGDLVKIDGYLPLYWDEANGKLLMEISRFGEEMLYHTALPGGVGSNPIGLDRNQIGTQHIVRFERVGPRVLMIEPNTRFRATTNDPAERRAVEDSFAQSVLAGFKVDSVNGSAVVVDAT